MRRFKNEDGWKWERKEGMQGKLIKPCFLYSFQLVLGEKLLSLFDQFYYPTSSAIFNKEDN